MAIKKLEIRNLTEDAYYGLLRYDYARVWAMMPNSSQVCVALLRPTEHMIFCVREHTKTLFANVLNWS